MVTLSIARRAQQSVVAAASIAIVVGCLLCNTASPQPDAPEVDPVCETLMADYLHGGKIESDNIDAAIQLIASRGRKGYWRTVLKEFQKAGQDKQEHYLTEQHLLTILTKMLERDGSARWLLGRPDLLKQSQWQPSVVLTQDVLDAVIAKAKEPGRGRKLDAFVVAVVAAHDKRATTFLLQVLNAKGADPDNPFGTDPVDPRAPSGGANSNAQFHAAVGLAELGERAGVRWLIESPVGGWLWKVSHAKVPSGEMLEARAHALADLTGLPNRSWEEWQAYWKENPIGVSFEPKARVQLRYP